MRLHANRWTDGLLSLNNPPVAGEKVPRDQALRLVSWASLWDLFTDLSTLGQLLVESIWVNCPPLSSLLCSRPRSLHWESALCSSPASALTALVYVLAGRQSASVADNVCETSGDCFFKAPLLSLPLSTISLLIILLMQNFSLAQFHCTCSSKPGCMEFAQTELHLTAEAAPKSTFIRREESLLWRVKPGLGSLDTWLRWPIAASH